jgi:hypothetical protein
MRPQTLKPADASLVTEWSYLAVLIDAANAQRSAPTSGKVDEDRFQPMEDEVRARRCIHCRIVVLPGCGA